MQEQVKQVLMGSLLGDGSLQKQQANAEFQEKHSLKQKDYLLWKKRILSKFFIMRIYDYDKGYIYLRSFVSPILNKYHRIFYPNKKGNKIITIKILNQLKPLGLAVWYMDDGTFNKSRYMMEFASHEKNIELIKSWFKKKYDVEGKIYSYNHSAMIKFSPRDTKKLFRIIHSYIHPSMKYKIKRTKEELLKIKAKENNYNSRPEIKEKRKKTSTNWQNEHKEERREYMKKWNRKNPNYYKKYRAKTKK